MCLIRNHERIVKQQGAGRAFCSGYDLIDFAQVSLSYLTTNFSTDAQQTTRRKDLKRDLKVIWLSVALKSRLMQTYVIEMPWDPLLDYQMMSKNTEVSERCHLHRLIASYSHDNTTGLHVHLPKSETSHWQSSRLSCENNLVEIA